MNEGLHQYYSLLRRKCKKINKIENTKTTLVFYLQRALGVSLQGVGYKNPLTLCRGSKRADAITR